MGYSSYRYARIDRAWAHRINKEHARTAALAAQLDWRPFATAPQRTKILVHAQGDNPIIRVATVTRKGPFLFDEKGNRYECDYTHWTDLAAAQTACPALFEFAPDHYQR